MQKKSYKSLKFLLGAAALTMAVGLTGNNANATNGYFSHGYGIKSKAMAGAGVAMPLDTISAASNPAAMAEVGKRYDVGVSFFMPDRSYTASPASTAPPSDNRVDGGAKSGKNLFVVPVMGANWQLTDTSTFGVAIFGNGGMNTDYNTATFTGMNSGAGTATSPTGVDLAQLFVAPTYAKKIGQSHSFGITPILAYQRFKSYGLEPFAGMSDFNTNVSNKGYDDSYGYGARIGYLGQVSPVLSVGLSYQTQIYMQEFDDYKGLFASKGDFDIPANWTVGFAAKTSPTFTVAFDIQKIYYSTINSIANTNQATSPNLGRDDGRGFGWVDMTIYKLGFEWQQSEAMTWRAGFSYGKQPIPTEEMLFNIAAPAVIEKHATLGLTKKIGESQELDIAIMRGFGNSVSGPNAFDPAQTIELYMDQWEVSLGYSWKF